MSRNNDVFQVLIPTVAPAAPSVISKTLALLLEGELGVYEYATNLPLIPNDVGNKKFYFAVGVDGKDAAGAGDINKSTGTHIDPKGIVANTFQAYVGETDMITNNEMKVLTCGSEIGVKVEIRNQEAYRLNGYNQVVRNYLVPTSDCVDCDSSCEDLNCVAVLTSLVDLINADTDAPFTASQVAPAAGTGDICTATGDPGQLILTVKPAVLANWCEINLGYFFPHQTEIIVTPLEGFEATVIATAMVYEQGDGHDIRQLEYEAGGWNGKPGPYRVSELVGTTLPGFKYYSDVAKNYDVQNIQHDQHSISGWRGDTAFERTIIASEDTLPTVKAFVDACVGIVS